MKRLARAILTFLLLLLAWLRAMPAWVAMKTGRRPRTRVPPPEPCLLGGWAVVGEAPWLAEVRRRAWVRNRRERVNAALRRHWRKPIYAAVVLWMVASAVKAEDEHRARLAADLRQRNELRALNRAEIPERAHAVKVFDLARAFRADSSAPSAYVGEQVAVQIQAPYVLQGRELHWHMGANEVPALVVFELAEPPGRLPPSFWIVGTCAGCTQDKIQREVAGFDFHVTVKNCSVIR